MKDVVGSIQVSQPQTFQNSTLHGLTALRSMYEIREV